MNLSKKILACVLAAFMAMSMMPLTAFADDASDLKAAITAYETKMDGTVYKNMKAAYDAYVTANAVYYGTNTSVTAAAAAADLTAKTNAMTAYSAYSGTNDVYFGSLAKTDSFQGYSNILYAYNQAGVVGIANSGDNYAEVGRQKTGNFLGIGNYNYRVYYKSFAPTNIVMYYNGNLNDLYYPVGVEVYANNDQLRTVDYIDVNDSNVGLKENWRGYQQGWDNTYGFNFANVVNGANIGDNERTYDGVCGLGFSSANTLSHTLSKDGASKNRFWINRVYITNLNNDNTLTKSSINFRLHVTDSDINVGSNPASTTVNSNIYVVNYYQVTQAIANNKSEFDDVESYKKGGLSTLLGKYDDATSYDITSYFTSANESNAGSSAATAETAAKAAANGVNNCAAPTKDNYTVTFKNAAGTTVDTKIVAAGSAIGALSANSTAAPTDSAHHNVYTWDGVTASTVVEYDTVYTETAAQVDCSFTAGAHTEATDAENGYTTYACVCGNSYKSYDAKDFTAYDAAVLESDSLKVDEAYTADSRTAYAQAVDAAKLTPAQIASDALAPKAIADATAAIIAAKSNLVLVPVDEPDNSYNLTLDDDIDVNFNIDTEYYGAEGGTIEISYVTTTDEKDAARDTIATYAVDDIETAGKSQVTMNAAPAQIAEPYVITIKDSNGDTVETIETSIVDYCDGIIAAPLSPSITEQDKEVARGLLDYGAAADAYFGYAAISETANYSVHNSDDYDSYVAGLNVNDIKARAALSVTPGTDASGNAVSVTGVSYIALTNPEFRFYVSQTNEVYAAMTDVSVTSESATGLSAEMVKTTNGFCVRVTGLKASDFGKNFTVTIGTYKITYNGYTFLYTILRSDTNFAENLNTLAKGTYRYAAACEAKFAD